MDLPKFFEELLRARSPAGFEFEAQRVYDAHVQPKADLYRNDALGNRLAILNPAGRPALMLAGSLDEAGLMITFVNKKGFLYFETLGRHDPAAIPGRRVVIQTAGGPIKGVTGKRAIHLLSEPERGKTPEAQESWIDIGAVSRPEALRRVAIGDVATFDDEFYLLSGSLGGGRAPGGKIGAYAAGEALVRLAQQKSGLAAKVIAVATVQREIGFRGAGAAGYGADPDIAVTVEGIEATDRPDCNPCKFGEIGLGLGPVICRGPGVNPRVYDRLMRSARKLRLSFQSKGMSRPAGTEACAIQTTRAGVATGIVGIPVRYRHTPCEMVDLADVEGCIQLLVEFSQDLQEADQGRW